MSEAIPPAWQQATKCAAYAASPPPRLLFKLPLTKPSQGISRMRWLHFDVNSDRRNLRPNWHCRVRVNSEQARAIFGFPSIYRKYQLALESAGTEYRRRVSAMARIGVRKCACSANWRFRVKRGGRRNGCLSVRTSLSKNKAST